MQVVGDKLVIPLEIVIADVEENSAVLTFAALFENSDREFVAFEKRRQQQCDEWLFQYLRQRLGGQQRDKVRYKSVVGRRLDHHGQFHGGRFHGHSRLGVRVKSAVDNVSPLNQFGHGRGIQAKALLADHGDETGAGLEVGIVKLFIALIALEVLGIVGRQEGALVVIEPPCDFGRTGVFEIDDGIFIAVELLFVKQRSGTVYEAGKNKFGVVANAFAVKT